MTALARSMILRLLVCDRERSMRKAASSSMPWRSIKMPLACSIVARRLNAPSRIGDGGQTFLLFSSAIKTRKC